MNPATANSLSVLPPTPRPRAADRLRFSVEWFDKPRADEWLARNTRNRAVNRRTVERLSAALRSGEWGIVPDCVAETQDGIGINGQHRMLAISETGIGAWMAVLRGFDFDDTFAITDDVFTRKFFHRLAAAGYAHPKSCAAILFYVWSWEEGTLSWLSSFKTSVTKTDMLDLAKRHDVSASAGWMESANRTHLGKSQSGFLHYITMKVNPTKAAEFWEAAMTGEGLVRGDPAYTLRERLVKAQSPVGRVDDRQRLLFQIQAWNAFARGEQMFICRESRNMKWPEIEGAPMPKHQDAPASKRGKE